MPEPRPRVRVIATGGSIAGVGPHRLDYVLYPEVGTKLTSEESLARIPEARDVADVDVEDLIRVGSPALGPRQWLLMARRINQVFSEEPDVSGVVVTHGTGTLEETAYFLHLTVKASKPVVITGSMRPPSAMGTDADLNLLDALRLAACSDAAGKGVLTLLNNQIHSARDVTKANTLRVETFAPGDLGFLGYVDSDAKVVFYRAPTRKHTLATPFDVAGLEALPRVDIVSAYAGADGLLVDAVRGNRSDGMVLAGFGSGHFPPDVTEAATRAVTDGIAVVMASRSAAGRVVMTPGKDDRGFIASDNLSPQKARILLMLALTVTRDRKEIQEMFKEL